MSSPEARVRLYLLRHGEVDSHRGDVPITAAAREQATETGSRLAMEITGGVCVLTGETRRARETAEHISKGLASADVSVDGPIVAHALRNPDLYMAGYRVNMVSSHEAFAAQVPGVDAEDIADLDFFPDFVVQEDRIGWWLAHQNPPGEGASEIAARIETFARSFLNPYREDRSVVFAVTHSPLLRAVALSELGRDIGEPPWISGLGLDIDASGEITTTLFTGDG